MRISAINKDYTKEEAIANDAYIAVDSEAKGTGKMKVSELGDTVILEYGDDSTYDDVLALLNAGKRVLVNVDPYYNNNNAINNEGVQKYPKSPYKVLLQANVPSGNPYIDFTGYTGGSVFQVSHVQLWNSPPSMPTKINNWCVNDVNPIELGRPITAQSPLSLSNGSLNLNIDYDSLREIRLLNNGNLVSNLNQWVESTYTNFSDVRFVHISNTAYDTRFQLNNLIEDPIKMDKYGALYVSYNFSFIAACDLQIQSYFYDSTAGKNFLNYRCTRNARAGERVTLSQSHLMCNITSGINFDSLYFVIRPINPPSDIDMTNPRTFFTGLRDSVDAWPNPSYDVSFDVKYLTQYNS